jgi:hypothetical protein
MMIDESEHLTAWERMQKRLAEAPIIQGRHGNVCRVMALIYLQSTLSPRLCCDNRYSF